MSAPTTSVLEVKLENWCKYLAKVIADEIDQDATAIGKRLGDQDRTIIEYAAETGAAKAFTTVLGVTVDVPLAFILLPNPPS